MPRRARAEMERATMRPPGDQSAFSLELVPSDPELNALLSKRGIWRALKDDCRE